ncbi:Nucleosome assembly NAP-1, partial [Olea europaea subsp. europaea]
MISEHDEAAPRFLKDIKLSRVDNPKGVQLTFHFDTNPYFKNSILTTTYHLIDEEKAVGPPEVPEEDEDIDEDAAGELQNLMEQDYDVGSTIRDKVILHTVSWFTGDAAIDEYGDIVDDDNDEDEDEDETKNRS